MDRLGLFSVNDGRLIKEIQTEAGFETSVYSTPDRIFIVEWENVSVYNYEGKLLRSLQTSILITKIVVNGKYSLIT